MIRPTSMLYHLCLLKLNLVVFIGQTVMYLVLNIISGRHTD